MTAVNIADDQLTVDLQGIDRFWALRRRISVPLRHVRSIARTPYRTWRPAGFRLLGAELPGLLRVGRFSYRGQRVFWDVHHPERSIEIELVSEPFDRLINRRREARRDNARNSTGDAPADGHGGATPAPRVRRII
jgi:hypothetical protein